MFAPKNYCLCLNPAGSLNIKRSSGYFEKFEMGSHFLDPRISKRTLKGSGLISRRYSPSPKIDASFHWNGAKEMLEFWAWALKQLMYPKEFRFTATWFSWNDSEFGKSTPFFGRSEEHFRFQRSFSRVFGSKEHFQSKRGHDLYIHTAAHPVFV